MACFLGEIIHNKLINIIDYTTKGLISAIVKKKKIYTTENKITQNNCLLTSSNNRKKKANYQNVLTLIINFHVLKALSKSVLHE